MQNQTTHYLSKKNERRGHKIKKTQYLHLVAVVVAVAWRPLVAAACLCRAWATRAAAVRDCRSTLALMMTKKKKKKKKKKTRELKKKKKREEEEKREEEVAHLRPLHQAVEVVVVVVSMAQRPETLCEAVQQAARGVGVAPVTNALQWSRDGATLARVRPQAMGALTSTVRM